MCLLRWAIFQVVTLLEPLIWATYCLSCCLGEWVTVGYSYSFHRRPLPGELMGLLLWAIFFKLLYCTIVRAIISGYILLELLPWDVIRVVIVGRSCCSSLQYCWSCCLKKLLGKNYNLGLPLELWPRAMIEAVTSAYCWSCWNFSIRSFPARISCFKRAA